MGLLAAGVAVFAGATGATAADVTPVVVPGNPPCIDHFKFEPVASGTFPATFGGEAGSITLTVRQTPAGPVFDFTTDRPTHLVTVALVKGGPKANRYDYGAGTTADTGLHAPLNTANEKLHGLSHVCFATALGHATPPPPTHPPTHPPAHPPAHPPTHPTHPPTPPTHPPADVCPNIHGVQTEVPPGLIKDAAGNCVAPPPTPPSPPQPTPPAPTPQSPPTDVCPNLEGVQTTVPTGMVKDASGSCVTPPGAPTPVVDLAVTKVDTPDPVSAGRELRYTIVVTNRGPAGATGVTVTDVLPNGLRIVSTRASQGSCTATAARITCRLGALAAGASATVTLRALPAAPGVLLNVARVHGNEPDSRPENNSSSVTTRVVAPFQPPTVVCDSVTVGTRTIVVGKRTTLRVVVKARGRALAGVRVRVRGAGIARTARTNRRGVAVVSVRAARPGIVSISVVGERCGRRIGAITGAQPDLTG